IANIGDTNFLSKLYSSFGGEYKPGHNPLYDTEERAFVFQEIQSENSKKIIEQIILHDSNAVPDTRKNYYNALGNVGDEISLSYLINEFDKTNYSDNSLNEAFALSVGRFALRKIINENSIGPLKYITHNTTDTIALRNTAFAFWRIGDKKLLVKASDEIFNLTKSKDPQTRMWAYNAMGKLQEKLLLMYTLESFNTERDWRVKVNMLNSITNFKLDSLSDITTQLLTTLDDGISDNNEHISLTAINVLGKLFADLKNSKNETARSQSGKLKEKFLFRLESAKNLSWRIRSELANSMSLVYKDESKNDLIRAFNNTTNYDLKSGILKAFGNFDDGMVYKQIRDIVSKDVQKYVALNPNTTGDMIGSRDLAKLYRGFVEMLSNLDEKVDEENRNTFRLIFTEFESSKDPAIADISLSALRDSLYVKSRLETSGIMIFDYNELEYPKDIDVMLIFIDAFGEMKDEKSIGLLENNLNSENYEIASSSAGALEKITGKKYVFDAKPRTDFDWNYMENLSQKKIVTVKTNKGDIKIELLREVAPFTVMNFLKLAEKNFYDGTIFHRVVSNFVIQGGDPTGTGYGGPGYAIRSEFSPLNYERGMVGMASSGKDTEGSQFFITHSATPHLDGKYTIFGKVTEGMDVVDKIMIGDFITNIRY
ncbi:MAG: peptidylprolyl isomerase, partial [bacterium]